MFNHPIKPCISLNFTEFIVFDTFGDHENSNGPLMLLKASFYNIYMVID